MLVGIQVFPARGERRNFPWQLLIKYITNKVYTLKVYKYFLVIYHKFIYYKIIYSIRMGKIKITVNGFRCERCGHEWIPREKKEYPKVCPKCKSPYWDIPRKKPVK